MAAQKVFFNIMISQKNQSKKIEFLVVRKNLSFLLKESPDTI